MDEIIASFENLRATDPEKFLRLLTELDVLDKGETSKHSPPLLDDKLINKMTTAIELLRTKKEFNDAELNNDNKDINLPNDSKKARLF
jgi:hypothetical protein